MMNSYDDMLNLPHHTSPSRPRMSNYNRAAQFAPFAALTGYEEAISETARITDTRIELDEYTKAELNEQLNLLKDHEGESVEVRITYYQPDEKKDGGAYLNVVGQIRKIDEYHRLIIMEEGRKIPIDGVLEISL